MNSFRVANRRKVPEGGLSRLIGSGDSFTALYNLIRRFNPFGRPIGGLNQPHVEVIIARHHAIYRDREPFRQRVGTAEAENISNPSRLRRLPVRDRIMSTILLIVVAIGTVVLGSVFTE